MCGDSQELLFIKTTWGVLTLHCAGSENGFIFKTSQVIHSKPGLRITVQKVPDQEKIGLTQQVDWSREVVEVLYVLILKYFFNSVAFRQTNNISGAREKNKCC